MLFLDELSSQTNVIVINPLIADWSFQLTTEAALTAAEITKNVTWVNLAEKGKVEFYLNPNDFISFFQYKNPLLKIKQILKATSINFENLKIDKTNFINNFAFNSIHELRDAEYKDLPLGAIIYSAVTSVKHTTAIDLTKDKKIIDYFLRTCVNSIDALTNYLEKNKFEMLITTNDRLPLSAIAVSIAEKMNMKVKIVYWGRDNKTIEEYDNSLYDSGQWQSKISNLWENDFPNERDSLHLKEEIVKLLSVPSTDSLSFTNSQAKGSKFRKNKFTVVFYAQSEHEHSPTFIQKNKNGFENQYLAFKALETVCKKFDFDVVLKLHPNRFDSQDLLAGLDEESDWKRYGLDPATTIIPKNSNLDTYQLINDADINVVWNSIVGVESIIRSKTTLVLGNAHWLNLNWGINAKTSNEIEQLFH